MRWMLVQLDRAMWWSDSLLSPMGRLLVKEGAKVKRQRDAMHGPRFALALKSMISKGISPIELAPRCLVVFRSRCKPKSARKHPISLGPTYHASKDADP